MAGTSPAMTATYESLFLRIFFDSPGATFRLRQSRARKPAIYRDNFAAK
jgi:hypothetical protein